MRLGPPCFLVSIVLYYFTNDDILFANLSMLITEAVHGRCMMRKMLVAGLVVLAMVISVVVFATEYVIMDKGNVTGSHGSCEPRDYGEKAARDDAKNKAWTLCDEHNCSYKDISHRTMRCDETGCKDGKVKCEVDSKVYCKCPVSTD
jgi:hypothetical protein